MAPCISPTPVRPGRSATLAWVLVLAGCASTPSLDMSDGPIEPPGQEIGIVIGSVIVHTDQEQPESWLTRLIGRKAQRFDYEFEIVKALDPAAPSADGARYRLDVNPGVERIFVARLPFGRYVINTFRYKGISILAGELGLRFVVAPRATLYVGRLVLTVPRRVTLGTPYGVRIDNAHEETISALQARHPGIGRDALDALVEGVRHAHEYEAAPAP